jgi:hypothetical protein
MPYRPFRFTFRFTFAALMAAVTAVVFTSAGAAADKPPTPVDESTLNPTSERFHAQGPHVGARTIQTWSGQDGTYSYSMVGVDPASNGAARIDVDIVPINVTVGGRDFNGSDVIQAVLASPLFQTGNYSSTSAASTSSGGMGGGGELSAGNVDVQYLDAVMRSQFNKVGTDYHLYLAPNVRRPVTIQVPAALGTLMTSRGGTTFADIDVTWFQPQVEALTASLHYLQPHRLALFITNGVMLYGNHNPTACCIFGAHGTTDTTAEGNGSEGRQSLQTFVWASWITPGTFGPTRSWAKQDIGGLSHEIAEWAADPFENNLVQPWFSPWAPQYGCSNLLEVGDPNVGLGFSQGSNTFDQNAWSDGTYHPQDEVFLPWFMRTSPNDVSQPTQSNPTVGRYTFMGDLNRVAFFHQPPAACTP